MTVMLTLCDLEEGAIISSIFKFISRSGVSGTNSMTDVRFLKIVYGRTQRSRLYE